MKTLRKTISLILILCICLSCFVPAHAAGSNLSFGSNPGSVEVGDTITVTVLVNGTPELQNFQGGISFNTSVFECTGISNGNGGGKLYMDVYDPDLSQWTPLAGISSTVSEANGNGHVGFSFIVPGGENRTVRQKFSALIVATFRAKAAGSASFSLYEDSAGTSGFKGSNLSPRSVSVSVPTYSIQFYANGHGTVPAEWNQRVQSGTTVSDPGSLSADGWVFGGWYREPECVNAFSFPAQITEDTIVYAKWTEVHVHTLVKTEAVEPGCILAGRIEYWTCSQCGAIFSDAEGKTQITEAQTIVDAIGHSWGEYKVTKEPTCTEGGGRVHTCTRCQAEEYEDMAALGHDWDGGKYSKEPTCTEGGTKVTTCTRCSETKTEEVGPLGHDYPAPRYTWSRDFSKVSASVTCSRSGCGHTVTETVPTEKRDDLAVCGQPGRTVYTASFSNALFTKQTKEIKTAVTPHTLVHYDSEDVGCGEPGRREYWYCSVCGKYFADKDAATELKPEDLTVEAVGHKFKEPVWTWSEDFGFASVKLVCERCNEEFEADGQITKNGNMRVATAKIEETEYKGYKYIDAPGHSVSLTSAKDPEGKTVKVEITDTTDEDIMTPEKAVLVQHEILKGGEAKDVNVLWQRGVEIPFGTGGTEVSFTVSGSGIGKQLLAYRLDPERGWELVGYANDTSIITVKLDDGGQIALAERPYKAPEDDKKTPDPAVVPKNGGNLKKWLLIGGAVLAVAAIAVLIIFLLPGKNKHYKKR